MTLPTVTSPTRTREFCCRLLTSGIWAWTTKEPGAAALGAGQRQRIQPAPAAAGHRRHGHDQHHAPHGDAAQPLVRHEPPPGRHHHAGQAGGGIGRDRRGCGASERASAARRVGGLGGSGAAAGGGGAAGGGRNVIGPHPVLAVGDLVGPGLRADEEVKSQSAESCTGGS